MIRLQIIDCCFAAVVSVQPTDSYYEKVSEELEKILNEVKEKEVETLTDGKKLFLFSFSEPSLKCEGANCMAVLKSCKIAFIYINIGSKFDKINILHFS